MHKTNYSCNKKAYPGALSRDTYTISDIELTRNSPSQSYRVYDSRTTCRNIGFKQSQKRWKLPKTPTYIVIHHQQIHVNDE